MREKTWEQDKWLPGELGRETQKISKIFSNQIIVFIGSPTLSYSRAPVHEIHAWVGSLRVACRDRALAHTLSLTTLQLRRAPHLVLAPPTCPSPHCHCWSPSVGPPLAPMLAWCQPLASPDPRYYHW